jgi:hypothetical protein
MYRSYNYIHFLIMSDKSSISQIDNQSATTSSWRRYSPIWLPLLAPIPISICGAFILGINHPIILPIFCVSILPAGYAVFLISSSLNHGHKGGAYPFSRQSLIHRLISNTVYDFVNGRPITISSIVINAILSKIAISTGLFRRSGGNVTIKGELKSTILSLVAVSLVNSALPYFGELATSIVPLVDHFMRVYIRCAFIAILDCFIAIFTTPPTTKFHKIALIFAHTVIVLYCTLQFTVSIGKSIYTCSSDHRLLISSYFYYSGLSLSDPHFLQKQQFAKMGIAGGKSATEVSNELLRKADRISRVCADDVERSAEVIVCLVKEKVKVYLASASQEHCFTEAWDFEIGIKCAIAAGRELEAKKLRTELEIIHMENDKSLGPSVVQSTGIHGMTSTERLVPHHEFNWTIQQKLIHNTTQNW